MVGRQLGPYTITSTLGAGGMGEVYRAHDPKLARDIAIKILPRAFMGDRDRLSRFEREARVLASLNHPLQNVLSPDDQWVATALADGATTNIWTISTSDGSLKQITDFGSRCTGISRSMSWSSDSRHIYAAVEESEIDVVLMDGLI